MARCLLPLLSSASTLWLLCTSLLLAVGRVQCDEEDHLYQHGDRLVLWVNNVGPYNNPQESYQFFSLPWCTRSLSEEELSDPALERLPHIGEILHGVEHVYSRIPIHFGQNSAQIVCKQTLDDLQAQALDMAIRHQFWYQMHLDDLPIWGMVGELVEESEAGAKTQRGSILGYETYIYTHKAFVISINGPRVISVNMTADDPVLVKKGATLEFSFSVEFVHTNQRYKDRFLRYLDNDFFQHQIHWFSILNAFMMVLFLCGVVAVILVRTLKRDYAIYNIDNKDLGAFGVSAVDDSGWKQIHGDIFRAPQSSDLTLLSVLIGNGVQFVILFLLVALTSLYGSFYMNRGATAKWTLIYFSITSLIAGFVSARFYKRLVNPKSNTSRHDWKIVMFLTGALVPGAGLMTLVYLNLFSIAYSTVNVVPFKSLALIATLIILVCTPMSAVGTLFARSVTGTAKTPCRVAPVKRPIDPRRWYLRPFILAPVAGILPFGSIFIEMYFMFSSFWNYKFYYVYGFLLLVFVILVMVTVCVTIVHTYALLNFEDYRWHWPAFFSGGSVAVYVYLYSIYYYFAKTAMSGLLQLAFYFTYMTVLSAGLFVMCGTIGYLGAELFVWRIYAGLKLE